MNIQVKKVFDLYSEICTRIKLIAELNSTRCMFAVGVGLLCFGLNELSYANVGQNAPFKSYADPDFQDGAIRASVGNLFALVEGAFGALIMVVSGLGAIVAAAMGAYRAAVGMLVVAVGAFILRALVSLFFGDNFTAVNVNQGNGTLTPE